MKIFVVSQLIPYSAMAIFPFILIKEKSMRHDLDLVNHELIHHRQQLELGILPFYIGYGLHYLYNLIVFKNHYKAYREIIFEREAYQMDKDFEYLQNRKWCNWRKF